MSTNAPETMGVIYRLQLSQLHPHPQNPFSIRDDQAMLDLIQSVQSHGVLVPAIARPRPDGEYEIIAGHRRKHASELAGLDFMPVVVLDLNDDEAIIQLVDSNIQRENILPSERAKAYKMRMEAMKRQGARTDLTSPNISAKFRSDDELGQEVGVSGDTIRNYASLTNLVPELMQMVDEGRIKLSPAYQIAALSHNEQAHWKRLFYGRSQSRIPGCVSPASESWNTSGCTMLRTSEPRTDYGTNSGGSKRI